MYISYIYFIGFLITVLFFSHPINLYYIYIYTIIYITGYYINLIHFYFKFSNYLIVAEIMAEL